MGRTTPTYRDAIRSLEERWAPMGRSLRREYQEDFDRLFERARAFADAAGMANPTDPERALLLSLLLAHEVECRLLAERVADLEADLARQAERIAALEERAGAVDRPARAVDESAGEADETSDTDETGGTPDTGGTVETGDTDGTYSTDDAGGVDAASGTDGTAETPDGDRPGVASERDATD